MQTPYCAGCGTGHEDVVCTLRSVQRCAGTVLRPAPAVLQVLVMLAHVVVLYAVRPAARFLDRRISMPAHRTPKTFQASAQTVRLIEALGGRFDLTNADVLARAVAEMAERAGVAVPAGGEPPHARAARLADAR